LGAISNYRRIHSTKRGSVHDNNPITHGRKHMHADYATYAAF